MRFTPKHTWYTDVSLAAFSVPPHVHGALDSGNLCLGNNENNHEEICPASPTSFMHYDPRCFDNVLGLSDITAVTHSIRKVRKTHQSGAV